MAGSPTIQSIFTQRVVVGVGDMAVSNGATVILSTFALGSCIGVVAFDAAVRAAGLLHLMLPDSSISSEKAATQPAMFADTGFPLLLRQLSGLKFLTARAKVYIAGGAGVISGTDAFRIGERNIAASRQWVQKLGLNVVAADVGGINNRTIHLTVSTGELVMKSPVETRTIDLR
jgi:chemotaxis protein CheD